MIDDLKELILKHNSLAEGIYIPYNVDEYIVKIKNNAVINTYYIENSLKGFIAYYINDPQKNAFLTMLLIDKSYQGKKIGKLFLESAIRDLKNRQFNSFALEVLKNNYKAISLYEQLGFKTEIDRGNLWLMRLNLKDK